MWPASTVEAGARPSDLLARKIEAIRAALARHGLDLFVNARTDVFLAQLAPEGQRVSETLARGQRYREAGADGLFVPALAAPEQIRSVVEGVALPINLLAWGGLPDAEGLQALGVRRLSAGSGITQVIWGQAEKLAADFLQGGDSSRLTGQIAYGRMQGLFK